MKIINPTFEVLKSGEVVPKGFEAGGIMIVPGYHWNNPTVRENLANCAWPLTLRVVGWSWFNDRFVIAIDEGNTLPIE